SDVLCIDTDSRSCSPKLAGQRAAAAARLLSKLGAIWIYKKVDSVLRGQVTAEIESILQQLGLRRALLAPANPGLGRLNPNGRYYVKGRPIHKTEFARDPEYPRASPNVLDLLGRSTLSIRVCSVGAPLPDSGIVVCQVGASADLKHWALLGNVNTLPAGG